MIMKTFVSLEVAMSNTKDISLGTDTCNLILNLGLETCNINIIWPRLTLKDMNKKTSESET